MRKGGMEGEEGRREGGRRSKGAGREEEGRREGGGMEDLEAGGLR